MRTSVWADGSAPVLLDPTDSELVKFAETERIDTLRVCWCKEHVAIGSGFGNTHSSVTEAGRRIWPRWFPDSIIVWRDGEVWRVNDLCGIERMRLESWLKAEGNVRMQEALEMIVSVYGQR